MRLSALLLWLVLAVAGSSQAQIVQNPCAANASGCGVTATDSPTSRPLAARAADVVNILDGFNGVAGPTGDGVQMTRVVTCTSGSPNVTINSADFVAADLNKVISISGCGTAGASLVSTILTVSDSTHLILADNASTTVSSVSKKVVYGTDDATSITAVLQAIKTLYGTSTGARPVSVFFPVKTYVVKSASLDFTLFRDADISGYGATIWCVTNGVACVDAMGIFNTSVRGLQIKGDSARVPTTGFQFGRYQTSGSYGLNHILDVTVSGNFTLSACYDMASETTQFTRVTCSNNQPSSWGMIADGVNHFGLTSQYVNNSLAVDNAFTFTLTNMTSMRILSTDATGNGMWVSSASGFTVDNGYIYTQGVGIWVYAGSGAERMERFAFHGNAEGAPSSMVFFERTTNIGVHDFTIDLSSNNITGPFISTSAVGGVVKLYDTSITIDNFSLGGTLFDDITKYWYAGEVILARAGTAPTLPAVMEGRLSIPDVATKVYNSTNVDLSPTQTITASSGTIAKAAGATSVSFEAWGAGSAGGNGLACGAAASCSGGGGGGAGGHLLKTAPMEWDELGVTSCSVTVGQSRSTAGVGGSTTITCGIYVWTVHGGGSGSAGKAAATSGGGGGGSVVDDGSATSTSTGGSAGVSGGSSGGTGAQGGASTGGQGSGGGGSSAVGVAASGGYASNGPTGGGAGGGCNAGTPATGGTSGPNEMGSAAGGNPGAAGKTSPGGSGTGGGGGDASTGAAGSGGAGAVPGGGGGGGGSACDGTGTIGVGGASGGGKVIVWQR